MLENLRYSQACVQKKNTIKWMLATGQFFFDKFSVYTALLLSATQTDCYEFALNLKQLGLMGTVVFQRCQDRPMQLT